MIEIKNVSKTYKNGVQALRNINLTIGDGEFCFIVGRSGSGKSTLVRLLTKELEPTEGEIVVNDVDLQHMKRRHVPKYRRRLGVVFQDFRLLEDRSVYENVAFAELIAGRSTADIRKDVPEMLEKIGLGEKGASFPRELSGGEQQRTAIARALINQPEILIADEPTGNLDHENAIAIMQLLESIHQQGTTVIVITHDLEMVRRMQKRTVHMAKGEVLSDEAALATSYEGDFETTAEDTPAENVNEDAATADAEASPTEGEPQPTAAGDAIETEEAPKEAPAEEEAAAPTEVPTAPAAEVSVEETLAASEVVPAASVEETPAAPAAEVPAAETSEAPAKELPTEETPAAPEEVPTAPAAETPPAPTTKLAVPRRRGLPGAHRPHRVPRRNGGDR